MPEKKMNYKSAKTNNNYKKIKSINAGVIVKKAINVYVATIIYHVIWQRKNIKI